MVNGNFQLKLDLQGNFDPVLLQKPVQYSEAATRGVV